MGIERARLVVPFAALALALTACGGQEGAPGEAEQGDALSAAAPASYVFTRIDARKCAFPTCGGVYVKAVNLGATRCADGSLQGDCRVLSEDLSGAGLTGDDAAKASQLFEQGHALLRGTLQLQTQNGRSVAVLVATDAFAGHALVAPSGGFYAVKDNGVRCAVAPCPWLDEQLLNGTTLRKLAALDLASTGVGDKQVQAGMAAVASGGLLVAGSHRTVSGPAGLGLQLVASEFYTRVTPTQPPVCGGIAGFQCPSGMACDLSVPNLCRGADLLGTCIVRPMYCYQIYQPVCGCDGNTYVNDCYRQRSGVQLAHAGGC